MSTRSSIYCQDLPDEANGIHVFADIDNWIYITRETHPYFYSAGIAVTPKEAHELAAALLKYMEAWKNPPEPAAQPNVLLPPLGFTREDVTALREVLEGTYDGMELAYWVGSEVEDRLRLLMRRIELEKEGA